MDLAAYVKLKDSKTMFRLHRDAGVSYTTVWKIVTQGHRLDSYASAKRLSEATGGVVSIAELCEKPAPKARRSSKSRRRDSDAPDSL